MLFKTVESLHTGTQACLHYCHSTDSVLFTGKANIVKTYLYVISNRTKSVHTL